MDSFTALLNFPLPTVFILILLILIFSSFLRISIIFSLLFYGLGLNSFNCKFITLALALSLSLLSMGSDLDRALDVAKFHQANTVQEKSVALESFAESWRVIIAKAVPETSKTFLINAEKEKNPTSVIEENSWKIIGPAFIISEIKRALSTGFKLLLPFLVIDLVIGYIFTAFDVRSMSSSILSFPLKLLIFISLDGITLVSSGILKSING